MKYLSHILWLAPFASFLAGYLLISFFAPNQTITTPAILGKNINDALITTSDHDLNIRIIGYKDEPDLLEGTILSQKPAAGKAIKKNQALYLVISRKPTAYITPNLYNKTAVDIAKLFENQSLQLKIYPIASTAPLNQCIAQWPLPGMELTDKTIIIYTAQPSATPLIMPNLKGRSVEDIVSFLSLHGITPTVLHSLHIDASHQCNNCTVLDQRPLPGSLVINNSQKPLAVQLQVG
jgi:beta-lactam-binding protein with PASTA domain